MDASLPELWCKVLIIVPLRALLDQFAVDFPGFCKVGTGHNEKIDFNASGFLAVSKSAHFLQKLRFDAVFVDEAHHRLPPKLPKRGNYFNFLPHWNQTRELTFSTPWARPLKMEFYVIMTSLCLRCCTSCICVLGGLVDEASWTFRTRACVLQLRG